MSSGALCGFESSVRKDGGTSSVSSKGRTAKKIQKYVVCPHVSHFPIMRQLLCKVQVPMHEVLWLHVCVVFSGCLLAVPQEG